MCCCAGARFSGLYLGIAADIEWSMQLFDPILQVPGAWMAVNAAAWLLLSLALLLVMRHIRRRRLGVMTVNTVLNRPITLEAWHGFVDDRRVVSEHGETDLSADLFVKRYSWTEPNARMWIGAPPAVAMEVDEKNGFALRVTLTSNRRHCKLSTAELQKAFIDLLVRYGVFSSEHDKGARSESSIMQTIGVGSGK